MQYNTAVEDTTGASHKEPYVFMHEFAHVIGANHNVVDATNNTTPLEPYAYGRWAADSKNGGLRTIESYRRSTCNGDCTHILATRALTRPNRSRQ